MTTKGKCKWEPRLNKTFEIINLSVRQNDWRPANAVVTCLMYEKGFHDFALSFIFRFLEELCTLKIRGTTTAFAVLTQESSSLIAHVQIMLPSSLVKTSAGLTDVAATTTQGNAVDDIKNAHCKLVPVLRDANTSLLTVSQGTQLWEFAWSGKNNLDVVFPCYSFNIVRHLVYIWDDLNRHVRFVRLVVCFRTFNILQEGLTNGSDKFWGVTRTL